jgi:hypothetical protein
LLIECDNGAVPGKTLAAHRMTRGARDEGMSGNSRFGQRRANALDCGFRRVVTNGDV